jgi:hypothetical protein
VTTQDATNDAPATKNSVIVASCVITINGQETGAMHKPGDHEQNAANNCAGEDVAPDCDALAKQMFELQGQGVIAWSELEDSDRAEWRSRAAQSLHALNDLGYRTNRTLDPDDARAAADRTIEEARTLAKEAERLLGLGEPLLAYNAVQQALADRPGDVRLRQLKGLALARSGALQRARKELQALRDEGFTDGETLGLLARTHKDLALATNDAADREQQLAAAFDIYLTGYRESAHRGETADAYYTGINAATIALLRGDLQSARDIAGEVEDLCKQALQDSDAADAYWPQATLAEAALILGDDAAARRRYATAAQLAGSRFGNLSSTRHQARLLLEYRGEDPVWLDDAMRVPPVLVFSGHMIDAQNRLEPRFTPQMEDAVRSRIREQLERISPVAVYGSAACGTDILVLECMQELGGELHIVLPFPVEEFRAASVDFRSDGKWSERFDKLLQAADDVLVIGEKAPPDCTSPYEYANLIMTGLARLRSEMLDTRLRGLAVWDGTGLGAAGGTGSVVSLWRNANVPLEHIDTAAIISPVAKPAAETADTEREQPAPERNGWEFDYAIKAMLFADAVGYSRLSEQQIPLFFEHYVGAIAAYNKATDHKPVHMETAGDGMYMVFDDTGTAGHYALGLSEMINACDWQSRGLPAGLSVRIGLHCGPVFIATDPITGQPLYSGTHTSRTARIEPITPPGQVYTSSAFAAVATALGASGLRFSYIGHTQLAKHYGILPLYHMKRKYRELQAAGS